MLIKVLILYFVIINLAGFVVMYVDKNRARKNKWRIRERTLFLTALFGGSFGVYGGMYCFRHKTKHISFMVGIPIIILLQVIISITIINR